MFQEETVFVLGAGASWHYGYPTGEELIEKVIQKAKWIANFTEEKKHLAQYWTQYNCPDYLRSKFDGNPSSLIFLPGTNDIRWALTIVRDECIQLATALRNVKPLVIDNFLGQSPKLEAIGKFIIAWVILECEKQYFDELYLGYKNINANRQSGASDAGKHKDDWCRFIVHRLAQNPKELLTNKVSFVTFNYDISLEASIYRSLQHIESFNKPDIKSFVDSERFLHMYGKIHDHFKDDRFILKNIEDGLPKEESSSIEFKRYFFIFNKTYECSKNIFTMEDCVHIKGDKNKCEDVQNKAREKIEKAKYVYILGYGFDERNTERLQLEKHLRDVDYSTPYKRIFFTNFGDKNLINKKASKIFLNQPDRFFDPTYIQSPSTNPGTRVSYFEKSKKNVYEALENDFDFL